MLFLGKGVRQLIGRLYNATKIINLPFQVNLFVFTRVCTYDLRLLIMQSTNRPFAVIFKTAFILLILLRKKEKICYSNKTFSYYSGFKKINFLDAPCPNNSSISKDFDPVHSIYLYSYIPLKQFLFNLSIYLSSFPF